MLPHRQVRHLSPTRVPVSHAHPSALDCLHARSCTLFPLVALGVLQNTNDADLNSTVTSSSTPLPHYKFPTCLTPWSIRELRYARRLVPFRPKRRFT